MLSSRLTLVALALLGGIFGVAWLLDSSAQSDRVRSALSNDSGDPKGLVVHGWADKNTLGPDETLYVVWTFENHSGDSIPVQVYLAAPGFESVKLPQPSFSIAAGSLKTIPLELHPLEGGEFRVTGRYQTPSVAGQTVLGPVDIATPGRRFIHIARQVYAVLKDLALPILLAYLAYFFQKRQKERDDAISGAREEREYRVQVRNVQLPRFQEYAENHYLPITRALRLLQDQFKLACHENGPSQDELGLLLYRLALFLKRMQLLRDQRGGVFFQASRPELILQSAWFSFNFHVEEKLGLKDRDEILALTRPDDDANQFAAKMGLPAVVRVLPKLKDWAVMGNDPEKGGLMNCMDLANIIQSILAFEVNRPLNQYWYEELDALTLKEFACYHIPLKPSERYTIMQKEIPVYRKEVDAYRAARFPKG